MSFENNSYGLPSEFLEQVVNLSKDYFQVEKIWIFGSRAKGKFRRNSDVDLAFQFPAENEFGWSKFCTEMEDEALILLPIDYVNINECSFQLKAEILKTGILIYEKRASSASF